VLGWRGRSGIKVRVPSPVLEGIGRSSLVGVQASRIVRPAIVSRAGQPFHERNGGHTSQEDKLFGDLLSEVADRLFEGEEAVLHVMG